MKQDFRDIAGSTDRTAEHGLAHLAGCAIIAIATLWCVSPALFQPLDKSEDRRYNQCMTATLEQIKREIRNLEPSEVEILLRDLQFEYVMPLPEGENEVSVDEAWDAEIAERVKDVEEGRVSLISGEESERRINALFAKHGLQRRSA